MPNEDNTFMSAMNPERRDYETPDGLVLAKDIAWVIKSLWGLAVVFAIAIAWGVTLANDVKNNSDKVAESATKEQIEQVLEGIKEIKGSLNAADDRQRKMQSQVDKLTADVETLKERVD